MKRRHRSTNRPSARRVKRKGPLVSIITVCRNSSATIAIAMESVLHQSYGNLEYLVVDGGSTDGTIDLLRTYEKRFHGRMRWTSEPDAGIYDAMNKGVKRAHGQLIGILNSDDWYETDAVEHVMRSFEAHGTGVYYGILRVHNDGNVEMLKAVSPQFLFRDVVGHPAYFLSRDVYDQHGAFNTQYRYAADYELMMRLHSSRVRFWLVERILANYRQGGQSTIHGVASLIENLRIRQVYGHLTKAQLMLRIFKYRLIALLRHVRVRP